MTNLTQHELTKRTLLLNLEEARRIIAALTEGVNPATGELETQDEVLNSPEIIRKLFLVREVLDAVNYEFIQMDAGANGILSSTAVPNTVSLLEDTSTGKASKSKKTLTELPQEIIDMFRYEQKKSVTKLIYQLYKPLEGQNVRMVSAMAVNKWLMSMGLIYAKNDDRFDGPIKLPTMLGEELGITAEESLDRRNNRRYVRVLLGRKAQEYIVENFNSIIGSKIMNEEAA